MALNIVQLDAVSINSATPLGGVETAAVSFGQQIASPEQNGQPTKHLITDAQPEISFTSLALDTLLALNTSLFASKGVALNGTTGAAGWAADLATDAGIGTTAAKFLIPYGLLIPEELSVDGPEGIATLSCRAIGRSNDMATAPMSIAAAQTRPTYTACNVFGMGRVEYNGTALVEVQRVSVRFGLEIKRFGGDGGIYSDVLHVVGARPEITVTVPDHSATVALSLLGARQGATATEIYFRKFDASGTRIATATAEHIKLSLIGLTGLIIPTAVQLPGTGEGSVELSYKPIWNGTNPQITVSTVSAIA